MDPTKGMIAFWRNCKKETLKTVLCFFFTAHWYPGMLRVNLVHIIKLACFTLKDQVYKGIWLKKIHVGRWCCWWFRNPAFTSSGSQLSRYSQGFVLPRWRRISSINSGTKGCDLFICGKLLLSILNLYRLKINESRCATSWKTIPVRSRFAICNHSL